MINSHVKDDQMILELTERLEQASKLNTLTKPHSVFVTFKTQRDYLIAYRNLRRIRRESKKKNPALNQQNNELSLGDFDFKSCKSPSSIIWENANNPDRRWLYSKRSIFIAGCIVYLLGCAVALGLLRDAIERLYAKYGFYDQCFEIDSMFDGQKELYK